MENQELPKGIIMSNQTAKIPSLGNIPTAFMKKLSSLIFIPETREEYDLLSQRAAQWDLEINEDAEHPLYALNEILVGILRLSKDRFLPFEGEKQTPEKVLQFLMDQHGLKQGDLKEIMPQSVVSEIFHGKRKLNRGQIEKLAKKFEISPATFFQ